MSKRVMPIILFLGIFCFFPFFPITIVSQARADIEQSLNGFYNQFGGVSNYTSGGAYKTQSGGFVTGGGYYARVPTKSYQLLSATPPSFRSGCGGIDMYLGSFSYINTDQLINAFKNIMGSASGYAFNLALETFAPSIYGVMQKINDIAREVNGMNINSCESAAQLVGGMWPQSEASSELLCKAMGTSSGAFSDYAKAKQACGVDGGRASTNKAKSEEFKDQLGDEYNLVWAALKNSGFTKETKELFMTLSGTVVSKIEGAGKTARANLVHYASQALDENFLDNFMYGSNDSKEGKAKIYQCDTDAACLNLAVKNLKISKNKSIVASIEKRLTSLSAKMVSHNGEATPDEIGLVNMTSIPILSIIASQNASVGGQAAISMFDYSQAIAYDSLLTHIEGVLDIIEQNLKRLEAVQINGGAINDFKTNLFQLKQLIHNKKFSSYQRLLTSNAAIEYVDSRIVKAKNDWGFFGKIKN